MNCGGGCGSVFKISSSGTETALYLFKGGKDGGAPEAVLIKDKSGNLYSTTSTYAAYDYGSVIKLKNKFVPFQP